MAKNTPHVPQDTNLHNLQLAYQRHAALANTSMAALLATMAELPFDKRMVIARAAIEYSNAEVRRYVAQQRCDAAKKAQEGK